MNFVNKKFRNAVITQFFHLNFYPCRIKKTTKTSSEYALLRFLSVSSNYLFTPLKSGYEIKDTGL